MLKKIQNLPEKQRKIILWTLMVIICAGLIAFFIKNTKDRFGNFNKQEFNQNMNFPNVGEELNKLIGEELPERIEQNATTSSQSATSALELENF